jgi:3-hydroxyacyl-CoA dehydrogenase/enoyl-CoA hydratase/3-hydroxybutyryl-CoA epimerase
MNFQKVWGANSVSLHTSENGLARIEFDTPGKTVNLLSSTVLEELNAALDEFEKLDNIVALIFDSAKSSFIVGADINEIVVGQNLPWQVSFLQCQRGKEIFARIANLSCRTVAAIHGRCMGGGLELALACQIRVATDSDTTLIGLPEVALGVLPGWGGTVRTTRLLGLKNALTLVLSPTKPWSAKKAWRLGLVSEVVPTMASWERVVEIALGNTRPKVYRPSKVERITRAFEQTRLGRFVIQEICTRQIRKATGDKYQAPYVALETMVRGAGTDARTAFNIESHSFAKLIKTPQCRDLVQQFFAMKEAKSDKKD